MFRNVTVLGFRQCRHFSFRNSAHSRIHPAYSSCLILTRNESTNVGTVENLSINSGVVAGTTLQNPGIDTAAAAQSSSIGNVAESVLQGIPEPPPVPLTSAIEEVVVQLAANGEPTLKSLGLGSWWPSGLVQQALELLHCNVGLPWWGAIAVGTVIIRLVLFPLVIKSQQTAARMHNNLPQMQVIQAKMTEARQTGNALMAAKYANDLMAFMKEKDISPFKQMGVPLVMAPIFLSCFIGLRGMANLPVESMKTGGMLWFTDLTVCDPYYILPVITSTTLWLTLELGADGAKLAASPGGFMMKYVLRAIPVILFPFTMNFPAALLCYWASTNAVSLVQVSILKLPKVREAFNIEPLLKHNPEDLPLSGKKKGFVKSAKESWTNMKISKEMEAREKFDEDMFKRAGRAPIVKTYKYDPTKVSPTMQAQAKPK